MPRSPLVRRSDLDWADQQNEQLRAECRRWKRLARDWHGDYQHERDRHWDLVDTTLGRLPAWVVLIGYALGLIVGVLLGMSW